MVGQPIVLDKEHLQQCCIIEHILGFTNEMTYTYKVYGVWYSADGQLNMQYLSECANEHIVGEGIIKQIIPVCHQEN